MRMTAAIVASALFCLAPGARTNVTKYAGIQPIDHPSSYSEKYFGEEVGLLTKGAVKVEVYHNTQLGTRSPTCRASARHDRRFSTGLGNRTSTRSLQRHFAARAASDERNLLSGPPGRSRRHGPLAERRTWLEVRCRDGREADRAVADALHVGDAVPTACL